MIQYVDVVRKLFVSYRAHTITARHVRHVAARTASQTNAIARDAQTVLDYARYCTRVVHTVYRSARFYQLTVVWHAMDCDLVPLSGVVAT